VKAFASHIYDKRLISKIDKELKQLNSNSNNQLKMSKDILKRRHTNGQQVYEKTSLSVRRIQIKTTMRHCLTPV
jgi:hypothetical protein